MAPRKPLFPKPASTLLFLMYNGMNFGGWSAKGGPSDGRRRRHNRDLPSQSNPTSHIG